MPVVEPGTAWSSEPLGRAPELHLVTRLADSRAWSMCARRQAAGARVRVVLLHDAVLETESGIRRQLGLPDSAPVPLTVLACARDAVGRGVGERWALVDYREIIRLSSESQPLICW